MSQQPLFSLLLFFNHHFGCLLLSLSNHLEKLFKTSVFKLAHLITVLLLVSQRQCQQHGYSLATVLKWGIGFDMILETFPLSQCPSVHSFLSFYQSLSSPSLLSPSAGFHYSVCSSITCRKQSRRTMFSLLLFHWPMHFVCVINQAFVFQQKIHCIGIMNSIVKVKLIGNLSGFRWCHFCLQPLHCATCIYFIIKFRVKKFTRPLCCASVSASACYIIKERHRKMEIQKKTGKVNEVTRSLQ